MNPTDKMKADNARGLDALYQVSGTQPFRQRLSGTIIKDFKLNPLYIKKKKEYIKEPTQPKEEFVLFEFTQHIEKD